MKRGLKGSAGREAGKMPTQVEEYSPMKRGLKDVKTGIVDGILGLLKSIPR